MAFSVAAAVCAVVLGGFSAQSVVSSLGGDAVPQWLSVVLSVTAVAVQVRFGTQMLAALQVISAKTSFLELRSDQMTQWKKDSIRHLSSFFQEFQLVPGSSTVWLQYKVSSCLESWLRANGQLSASAAQLSWRLLCTAAQFSVMAQVFSAINYISTDRTISEAERKDQLQEQDRILKNLSLQVPFWEPFSPSEVNRHLQEWPQMPEWTLQAQLYYHEIQVVLQTLQHQIQQYHHSVFSGFLQGGRA